MWRDKKVFLAKIKIFCCKLRFLAAQLSRRIKNFSQAIMPQDKPYFAYYYPKYFCLSTTHKLTQNTLLFLLTNYL